MKNNFINYLQRYFDYYLPNVLGLSNNTIKSYKYTFKLFYQYVREYHHLNIKNLNFQNITKEIVEGFLDWLINERKCSISTRNQRLAAISSFANYAQTMTDDAFELAKIILNIPIKRADKPNISFFTNEELRILLSLPNTKTKIGYRDNCLLSLMYATGARAQEICDLKVQNILFDQNGKTIVVIKGKGEKVRRVAIPTQCAIIVQKYIKTTRKQNDSYLFSSQTHAKMTISCIEEIFKKYIQKAKQENPELFNLRFSPHSMRHTTATHMLEAGVPLIVIKNFLGHASLETTQIYAEVTQATANKYLIDWYENQKEEKKENVELYPDFLR